ncbi:MAG: hypothetical protein COA73_01940 [Candidatus Hydrogenedentota bacterium]|nr:MAG: hypothetical protein COA73_01940 [Candidatus Hydrogenedentota bacterium]
MKYILKTIGSALVLLLISSSLTGCFVYNIGANDVGVKTNKTFIGGKGVQEEVGEPGTLKFYSPFLHDWHSFNKQTQTLEMTATLSRGDRTGRDDMRFKTIDGNDISLDITIQYRIDQSKAPHILQYVARNDDELKNLIIRTIARSKPRDIFGELDTEEFYDAVSRTKQASVVRDTLNVIMEPYGVVIEQVLTGDYRFNPAYQKAIEDKKVADQQVEKNKSAANAAEEDYKRKVEEAKGEVAKMTAEADGDYEVSKIEVDAYYEQQERLAEAIMIEGLAEAEGITKMNEALSGAGGEAMVKLKIAEALNGKKIVMLPIGGGGLDVRTTDINALLQLYGIEKLTGK